MKLTEELEAVQQVARDFARRSLMPLEKSVIERESARGLDAGPVIEPDDEARLTAEVRELGLWGIEVPEKL